MAGRQLDSFRYLTVQIIESVSGRIALCVGYAQHVARAVVREAGHAGHRIGDANPAVEIVIGRSRGLPQGFLGAKDIANSVIGQISGRGGLGTARGRPGLLDFCG